jgi:hypothetical protein
MQIHGLEPATGEPAFAFCVLRLRQATARDALMELIEALAPLIPDADTVIEDLLPEDLEQAVRIIAVPWQPGDVEEQRAVIERVGVDEAWFFQTTTSLPPVDEDGDDDDDDLSWTAGPPPQVTRTRFPVDATEDPDTADFGIAVKLAGEILPGEGTVLLAFHTLWLAPYGGRYRNSSVTIDRVHHAAHFWVDRFEAPCDADVLVGHLRWIVAKLDEVIPVVHARIAEATLTQKYGELMGEDEEPFVLGGNPLLSAYALGGEAAVDDWIAKQTVWSNEEVAQMLREVAVEIVTAEELDDEELDDEELDDEEPAGRRATQMKAITAEDLDAIDQQLHEELQGSDERLRAKGTRPFEATRTDEDVERPAPDHASDDEDWPARPDDDRDDDEPRHDDRGRAITAYAADILRERARLGRLDPRAVEPLRRLLGVSSRFEVRRRAAIDILGAARARAAVASLVAIARKTTPDSAGKSELLTAAVTALGQIGDAAALQVLADIVAADAPAYDAARVAAAGAFVACRPREQADDPAPNLDALLAAIRDRGNAESRPAMLFAAGRLARVTNADATKRVLAELYLAGEDPIVLLAREGALVMLGEHPSRQLAALLHECLTIIDFDHDSTIRKLRVALQVAELVPAIVDAADLTWLTCFVEADIRARAHGLLERLGKPLMPAPVFDRYAVRSLGDDDVIELVAEARVVGRAALVAEAARRSLVRAVPAMIDACHDVISRARHGEQNLLDPDMRTLEAAVPFLRRHLDDQVIALFDRMLRHPSVHVKWELLHEPPLDERLIGGMFHVLGERWGWQEETARTWLAKFRGTARYELERRRVPTPLVELPDGPDETNDDDQDMN